MGPVRCDLSDGTCRFTRAMPLEHEVIASLRSARIGARPQLVPVIVRQHGAAKTTTACQFSPSCSRNWPLSGGRRRAELIWYFAGTDQR
jgi:hypothetical protein